MVSLVPDEQEGEESPRKEELKFTRSYGNGCWAGGGQQMSLALCR